MPSVMNIPDHNNKKCTHTHTPAVAAGVGCICRCVMGALLPTFNRVGTTYETILLTSAKVLKQPTQKQLSKD